MTSTMFQTCGSVEVVRERPAERRVPEDRRAGPGSRAGRAPRRAAQELDALPDEEDDDDAPAGSRAAAGSTGARDARPGRLELELEAAVQLVDVVLSRDAHARRFLLAARSSRSAGDGLVGDVERAVDDVEPLAPAAPR